MQSVWECSTLKLYLVYDWDTSVTSTIYNLFYMEFLKLWCFICVYKDVKTVFCTTMFLSKIELLIGQLKAG